MTIYNFYTDASTINSNYGSSSGIAVVVVNIDEQRMIFSIGKTIDVGNNIEAELKAIELALISGHSLLKEDDLIRICSDCEPALEIAEGDVISYKKELREVGESIDQIIKDYRCDIEFQWVRGHADNEFNNMTDYLAYHHAQG